VARESWRDDPDLIRQKDEEDLQQVVVDADWAMLFNNVEGIFVEPTARGLVAKGERAVLRGFMFQAKKKVSKDPTGARDYVLQSLRMVCACLKIEPTELYLDREQLLAVLQSIQPTGTAVMAEAGSER
jgi:hypothetical protein